MTEAQTTVAGINSTSINNTPNLSAGKEALASILEQNAVPMATLHDRYGPLLQLVRVLIGVVPNCDTYLEIWPPAFKTYNIVVPNFLNLPFSIFGVGGAPKDITGMGMYVASRAAECSYCSAHTCSFALRRGATPEKMARALVGGDSFTQQELATIAVARSLARVPCELTAAERDAMNECFSPVKAEWVVLGIVMMGFLNKFMDATGVALERSTFAETRSTMGDEWSAGKAGWNLDSATTTSQPPESDSILTKLSVIRHAPTALKLDKEWQKGVPDVWPAVGEFLQENTGHNFPVLSRMHTARGIRAVASALRENLNKDTTVIGMKVKVLAGVIFSTVVQDQSLAKEIRQLGVHHSVSDQQLDEAARFAIQPDAPIAAESAKERTVLLLARAAAPSPAEITASVVNECRESKLSAQEIVELVTWLSVLQMLHRLSSYYADDGI